MTNTANYYGMTTFNKVDSDGKVTEELIMVSDKLYRLKENNFIISRSNNVQISSLFSLSATGVFSGTGTSTDPFKLSVPVGSRSIA